jgi:hypothetical protein
VTLTFALDHAPFPAPGKPWRDRTVIVFVPHHFRLPESGRADLVVHFHGHNAIARVAMARHQIREQLADSKQNAILVAPQGPLQAADSHAGKLESPNGLRRLVDELVEQLRHPKVGAVLEAATLAELTGEGLVCLSAHSGGYRAAASCLRTGGVPIAEVYLFDALYGLLPTFQRWVIEGGGHRGRARHKLVSVHSSATVKKHNLLLAGALEKAGVDVLVEDEPGSVSRAALTRGRAVFLASALPHRDVIFRHNGLRDCLFASGFRRRLDSDWFAEKDEVRPIERRLGDG